MKLPDLAYVRPTSLDAAIRILADHGGEAKVISGGQSLMPLLALRLAAPRVLVDLAGVAGLDQLREGAEGTQIGARVRWRDIEKSALLAVQQPLLVAAVAHVAHYQIRNRGTVGGSLAHADPSAELPAVALTCDGVIVARGPRGERRIAAADFFRGPLMTALEFDEIVVALHLPKWRPGRRHAFQEFARRRGDFALAGVALQYDLAEGRMADVHVGAFGVADTPVRLPQTEAALTGQPPGPAAFEVAGAVAAQEIDPMKDLQAEPAYRRALLATLLRRGLEASARQAA